MGGVMVQGSIANVTVVLIWRSPGEVWNTAPTMGTKIEAG
jgi:hypothetical protein